MKKPDRTRWDDRKLDHVRPYLDAAEAEATRGVVAIVAAQEFQWVFRATNAPTSPAGQLHFVKEERRVAVYYFYVLDPDFGPGFIKVCTYFPYPAKVWLNGHEWAKRQARPDRIVSPRWPTGSPPATTRGAAAGTATVRPRRCPEVLRALDRRIPTPLTTVDRRAGYWWELSMRQVEVSRTLVFDDPRRARGFFEALGGRQHRHRPASRGRRRVRARRRYEDAPKNSSGPACSPGHRGQDGLHPQV